MLLYKKKIQSDWWELTGDRVLFINVPIQILQSRPSHLSKQQISNLNNKSAIFIILQPSKVRQYLQ